MNPAITPLLQARMSNAIRFLSADAVEKAQSGHPGMPLGMADVATVLFSKFLKFEASNPHWPDRDRFVLSAGHGSMLLYSLLYLTGYKDMSLEDIKNFRILGSKTAGHPEYGHAQGIETTTGPLGQGLGNAVGMALAEEILRVQFGNALVNHRTYCIAGDGCLMEGISHEAISLAGHLGLSKLTVLFDDNQISIDGPTSLSTSEDTLKRFDACGWATRRIDGHDFQAIEEALTWAQTQSKPTLIACRTQIGRGAPTKVGTARAHGSPLGATEIAEMRKNLNWDHAPFEIPEDILSVWRMVGARNNALRSAWEDRFHATPTHTQQEFMRRQLGDLPHDAFVPVEDLVQKFLTERPKLGSRQYSQKVLDVLAPTLPELVGGSADLTESNNTHGQGMQAISPRNFQGNYIHYGIREHGMSAVMNGIALHGGIIPYGGTFLVFSDYARPAIRLSALMGIRVIYVFTHDSIGLGEDGPTHQPIEHLASLRFIPNLLVFRPCDGIETVECWLAALEHKGQPSVLALSRQGLPTVRTDSSWTAASNRSVRGAYILRPSQDRNPAVTLMATGSEVPLALEAQAQLEGEGISTAVVSVPCVELFLTQEQEYQAQIIDPKTLRISIEAGIGAGWERLTGSHDNHVGMHSFGASGKGDDVLRHFGFTPENIVNFVKKRRTDLSKVKGE